MENLFDKKLNPARKKRALFFLLDCLNWSEARLITYNLNYGFIEGLYANGIECFIVPIFGEISSSSNVTWASYMKDALMGQSFDLVFFVLPHSKFENDYWEWIASIAPVRIGILMESMRYDPVFTNSIELLRDRASLVESQLHFCTHLLASDCRDVVEINEKNLCKAYWYPPAITSRQVVDKVSVPFHRQAAFFGTAYYHRNTYLQNPSICRYMIKPNPPENNTPYPEQFNELNKDLVSYLQKAGPKDFSSINSFVDAQGANRKNIDNLWMSELKKWQTLVNLPSLFNGYASRVIEAMAAGRPVISWRIPTSPNWDALFVDGEEILLFDQHRPDQLVQHLETLISNENLANQIAEKALIKVRNHHTIEGRISHLMNDIYGVAWK